MTLYKCFNCRKIVDIEINKQGFKCPECGGKIFFKLRPSTPKRIKAR
jgi:DNA-directed RNA polymerase subunit RPC12/RpoP